MTNKVFLYSNILGQTTRSSRVNYINHVSTMIKNWVTKKSLYNM